MIVFTGWPPLKRIMVGIESTWNCAAVCWFSSVLSLTTRRSGRSEAISSSTGATTRQGPHQGAQKSTSTGPSASMTSAWKLLSVTSLRLPAMCLSLSRRLATTIQSKGAWPKGPRACPHWHWIEARAVLEGLQRAAVRGTLYAARLATAEQAKEAHWRSRQGIDPEESNGGEADRRRRFPRAPAPRLG